MNVRAAIAAALMMGTVGFAPAPATAVAMTIQPGARNLVADETAIGSCTLGFVYDGLGPQAGRVFIGTAAHCVTHVGQDVALPDAPHEVFGDVAVIGDLATAATDWALIEVRPDFVARVSPAVLNHSQFPTGATASAMTAVGDLIQLNDLGVAPRPWVPLTFDDPEIYRTGGTLTMPPSTVPFDSGGPLVHLPSGGALGSVSRGVNCSLPSLVCEEYEGPTVEGIVAKAAAVGFPIALRTV